MHFVIICFHCLFRDNVCFYDILYVLNVNRCHLLLYTLCVSSVYYFGTNDDT